MQLLPQINGWLEVGIVSPKRRSKRDQRTPPPLFKRTMGGTVS